MLCNFKKFFITFNEHAKQMFLLNIFELFGVTNSSPESKQNHHINKVFVEIWK